MKNKMLGHIIKQISSTERSGIINMCIKPISMVISLLYVPVLLSYLGDAKYGLWATLLSIINWINYFDVGIGNGLRNILSKELSKNELEEARKSVSTAYILLSGVALIVYAMLLGSVFLVDWKYVFSTDINVTPTLIISFTFISINFVLALSNTLWYALQKPENVSIRGCFVQLCNLIGIIVLKQFSQGSLIAVSILFGASTLVIYLINTYKIMTNRISLRPSKNFFAKEKISAICNVGIKFFLIQLFCILLFTVDNLLITHFFGAEEVTPFSIVNKVFNTAYTVFAAFLVPYWSRSTAAFVNHDKQWIKNSVRKTFYICLLFIGCYTFIMLIFKPAVRLWLGRDLDYQNGLILLMFIFYSIYSILAVECQFINGSGKINIQLIIYAIIGTVNIPLSIFLGVNLGLGVIGIRLATTILIFIEVIVLGVNLKCIMNGIDDSKIQAS